MSRVIGWVLVLVSWLGMVLPAQAQELPPTAADGAALFEVHCVGCHINGGNIVRRGKNLRQRTLEKNGYDTVEAIAQLVAQGKGNMSAYATRMSADEIQAVAQYVLEQAAQDWKP